MSEGWFELLAALPFLRRNYRHFNAKTMPPWCRGDSVLAERLEDMIELVRAMRDSENEVSLMQEFARPFK